MDPRTQSSPGAHGSSASSPWTGLIPGDGNADPKTAPNDVEHPKHRFCDVHSNTNTKPAPLLRLSGGTRGQPCHDSSPWNGGGKREVRIHL